MDWLAKRLSKTYDTGDHGEKREARGNKGEIQMRSPNLPLHIKFMAHRVKNERVQGQSRDIDEQQATGTHACSQHRRGSLPKEAARASCHRPPAHEAQQFQGKEDDEEHQEGCWMTYKQSPESAKSYNECYDDQAGHHV